MKKRILLTGIVVAAIGIGVVTNVPSANADSTKERAQIIVKFRNSHAASSMLKQFGATVGRQLGDTGANLVEVPVNAEDKVVAALSKNPAVEYAEPDEVAYATTDDTYFNRQYALNNDGQSFTNNLGNITIAAGTQDADIDALEAWATGATGAGVKVAVLDSGVTKDNDDISSKVVDRANFTTAATDDDNYGHGTHVAGIIAASQNNAIGVSGVCPECTIMSGKVLGDNGVGSTSSIVNGIAWAVQNKAKVINMSLGARSSRTLEAAINNAWNKGVVVVAAAGNGGSQTKVYPGAYTNVIAVAATDNNDKKAAFSSYGANWVDIAAPGDSIFSTFPNHSFFLATEYGRSEGYDIGSGTSMASPYVAGAAALVWSVNPNATNAQVRTKLQSSADKIAGTGSYWANGRLNVANAVTNP